MIPVGLKDLSCSQCAAHMKGRKAVLNVLESGFHDGYAGSWICNLSVWLGWTMNRSVQLKCVFFLNGIVLKTSEIHTPGIQGKHGKIMCILPNYGFVGGRATFQSCINIHDWFRP